MEDSAVGFGQDDRITGPTRVVIADDELIGVGLREMLSRHTDQLEIIRVPPDDLGTAARLDADVVLVDIRPAGRQGLAALGELMATEPPLRVVVFTTQDNDQTLLEALRLGVSGYLLKTLGGAELVDHLLRVQAGEVVVDPTLAARLTTSILQAGDAVSTWPGTELGLTQRESEVLGFLVEGMSNRQIAEELYLGDETVKTHLRSIYRKLGVNDRAQAVATALRQGILV